MSGAAAFVARDHGTFRPAAAICVCFVVSVFAAAVAKKKFIVYKLVRAFSAYVRTETRTRVVHSMRTRVVHSMHHLTPQRRGKAHHTETDRKKLEKKNRFKKHSQKHSHSRALVEDALVFLIRRPSIFDSLPQITAKELYIKNSTRLGSTLRLGYTSHREPTRTPRRKLSCI